MNSEPNSDSLNDESEPTLRGRIPEAQQRVDQWIRSVGVRYFSELTNLAQLVEEVGEVARILSRTYGDQSSKQGEVAGSLADELADVMFRAHLPCQPNWCRSASGRWNRTWQKKPSEMRLVMPRIPSCDNCRRLRVELNL